MRLTSAFHPSRFCSQYEGYRSQYKILPPEWAAINETLKEAGLG